MSASIQLEHRPSRAASIILRAIVASAVAVLGIAAWTAFHAWYVTRHLPLGNSQDPELALQAGIARTLLAFALLATALVSPKRWLGWGFLLAGALVGGIVLGVAAMMSF